MRTILIKLTRMGLLAALAGTMFAMTQFVENEPIAAADLAPAVTIDVAAQAAPDEGGTGVNNFKREEWFEFAVLLAPFLVLVTFILILTFNWDRSTGNED